VSIDFTTEQAGYNAAYVRISLQRNYTVYRIVLAAGSWRCKEKFSLSY